MLGCALWKQTELGGKGFVYEANAGNRESGRGSSSSRLDAHSPPTQWSSLLVHVALSSSPSLWGLPSKAQQDLRRAALWRVRCPSPTSNTTHVSAAVKTTAARLGGRRSPWRGQCGVHEPCLFRHRITGLGAKRDGALPEQNLD